MRDTGNKNLAVCVFESFTTAVSLTMLLPFLPIFVEELGINQRASVVQWSGLALAQPPWEQGSPPFRATLAISMVASQCSCGQPLAWLSLLVVAAEYDVLRDEGMGHNFPSTPNLVGRFPECNRL
jgi:hypothetical protein